MTARRKGGYMAGGRICGGISAVRAIPPVLKLSVQTVIRGDTVKNHRWVIQTLNDKGVAERPPLCFAIKETDIG